MQIKTISMTGFEHGTSFPMENGAKEDLALSFIVREVKCERHPFSHVSPFRQFSPHGNKAKQ